MPAAADAVDWQAVDAHGVVRIVTRDPDGNERDTKVWIAVVDGTGWLRTASSRWLANIRRDPHLVLRAGDERFELRAREVTDPEAIRRVDLAMRRKYGWADWWLAPVRWRETQLLRLEPRTP